MSDLNQADTNEVAKQDHTEQSTVTPDQITRNIVKAKRRFADDEGEPVQKGKFTLVQSFGSLDLSVPVAKPTFNFALDCKVKEVDHNVIKKELEK